MGIEPSGEQLSEFGVSSVTVPSQLRAECARPESCGFVYHGLGKVFWLLLEFATSAGCINFKFCMDGCASAFC